MRQFFLWLLVTVQIFFVPKRTFGQIVAPPENQLSPLTVERIDKQDLCKAIDAIINRPQYQRAHWGILIQPLDSPKPLYSLNADKNFVPASNVKLLVTAAALLKLRTDFRFRTSVYRHHNDITVVGGGDPTLTTAQLQTLAQQLKQQGIKKINHLTFDISYLPHNYPNTSWEWSDLYTAYGVTAGSFNLNQNAVKLTLLPQKLGQPVKLVFSEPLAAKQWKIDNQAITTKNNENNIKIMGNFTKNTLIIQGELPIDSQGDEWEISIPNPNQYFADVFVKVLSEYGIQVKSILTSQNLPPVQGGDRGGGEGSNSVPTDSEKGYNNRWGIEIAKIESDTLSKIIKKINQDSNNLYAEALLNSLGKEGHTNDSIEVVKETLKEVGIESDNYHLVDGSGLSRQNLVSPQVIIQTLKVMLTKEQGAIYRESLAKAGVSGTLKNRFEDTPLVGMLEAKTGTLTGVSSLSGYLLTGNNRVLVFSIIVNKSEQNGKDLRQGIDEIIGVVFDNISVKSLGF